MWRGVANICGGVAKISWDFLVTLLYLTVKIWYTCSVENRVYYESVYTIIDYNDCN